MATMEGLREIVKEGYQTFYSKFFENKLKYV